MVSSMPSTKVLVDYQPANSRYQDDISLDFERQQVQVMPWTHTQDPESLRTMRITQIGNTVLPVPIMANVLYPNPAKLSSHKPWIVCQKIRSWFKMNLSAYELKNPNADWSKMLHWSEKKAERFFARAAQTQQSTKSKTKALYLSRLAFYYSECKGRSLAASGSKDAIKTLTYLTQMRETYSQELYGTYLENGGRQTQAEHALAPLPTYTETLNEAQGGREEPPPSYEGIVRFERQDSNMKWAIVQAAQKAKAETGLPSYGDIGGLEPYNGPDPLAKDEERGTWL